MWRFVLIFFFLACSCAGAADLAWNPNSESDLAGYKIYYGSESGIYQISVDVGNVTRWHIPDYWPNGSYFFAATAYDIDLNESAFSNEVIFIKGLIAPASGGSFSLIYLNEKVLNDEKKSTIFDENYAGVEHEN